MIVTMAVVHADQDSGSKILLVAQNLSIDKAAKTVEKIHQRSNIGGEDHSNR